MFLLTPLHGRLRAYICLLRLLRLHAEIKIFNKNDLNFVLSLTANITKMKTSETRKLSSLELNENNFKIKQHTCLMRLLGFKIFNKNDKREETKNEKHNLESSFG